MTFAFKTALLHHGCTNCCFRNQSCQNQKRISVYVSCLCTREGCMCMGVWVGGWGGLCVHACIHAWKCICVHVYMHLYACMNIHVYVHVRFIICLISHVWFFLTSLAKNHHSTQKTCVINENKIHQMDHAHRTYLLNGWFNTLHQKLACQFVLQIMLASSRHMQEAPTLCRRQRIE